MVHKSRSKKGKRLDASAPDLISDMPRNILDGIMEGLPICDAARMGVLSCKWHDIWTSTPHLNFDAHFYQKHRWKRGIFCRTVSKILLQHHGPIFKFSLYVDSLKSCPEFSQWLSFLSRNGITDFSLENKYYSAHKLSSCLFSCVELERLKLRHCVVSPCFGGFAKLVILEFQKVKFTEDTLIVSCPLLENLSITECKDLKDIKVDAPNLRHLTVDGTFNSLSVQTAVNLVSAAIALRGSVKTVHKTSLLDLMEVLAKSSKLENLYLRGYLCKVLCKARLTPMTFKKLRVLKLSPLRLDWIDDFSFAIDFVKSCPNIENLDISVSTSNNLDPQVLATPHNLDFTLRQIRCAKMSIYGSTNAELKLMEFLLDCSPVLEVFSVSYGRRLRSCSRSSMLTQLTRFHRASPKAEVIFPDPVIPVDSSDESDTRSNSSSDDPSEPDDDSSDSSDSDVSSESDSSDESDSSESDSSDSD